MTGMMENAFLNVKGVHDTITAEVELNDAKTQRVIIAQAGYFGGWVLYMKDGNVHHKYNFFGLERTNIASVTALAPGKHTIVYEFLLADNFKEAVNAVTILPADQGPRAENGI